LWCFEAGGLTLTQSSATASWTPDAANGCLVAHDCVDPVENRYARNDGRKLLEERRLYPRQFIALRVTDWAELDTKKGRAQSPAQSFNHPHRRSGRSAALPYPACGQGHYSMNHEK
jgi:hypothetical protein